MFAALLHLQTVWLDPRDPYEGTCGWRPPPTEPPTRAVVGAWGEPSSGLSIRVLADSTRFDLGAGIGVGIGFRFDATGTSSPPSILDFAGEGRLVLRLAAIGPDSVEYGVPFTRFEYSGGMPGCFRARCVRLDEVRNRARFGLFHLLAESAQQVAPGRYRMTIQYDNSGGPLVTCGASPIDDFYSESCWAPPESVWVGTIDSAPVAVEVVDRPPTEHRVLLPTRLILRRSPNDRPMQVAADSTSPCEEVVSIRPGYFSGIRSWNAVYVDDAPPISGLNPPPDDPEELFRLSPSHPDARCVSRGTSGRLESSRFNDAASVPCQFNVDLLDRGTRYRFRRKIVVFETSTPDGHLWTPEDGDYRVLAERTLEVNCTRGELCP